MDEAIKKVGSGYTDEQINYLAQRHFENTQVRHILFETPSQIQRCRISLYYPPHAVFDPYRGKYGAGYILFVYNGASVPWITGVNNLLFFTNISETMSPTNMYYYISLERSFYSSCVLHKNPCRI